MPKVARGNGVDSVLSATGAGPECPLPLGTSTNQCSPNVFVNGTGVVRKGDIVTPHTMPGCGYEAPPLGTYSPNVLANQKNIGRIGDNYPGAGSNIITSGSPNVIANG